MSNVGKAIGSLIIWIIYELDICQSANSPIRIIQYKIYMYVLCIAHTQHSACIQLPMALLHTSAKYDYIALNKLYS